MTTVVSKKDNVIINEKNVVQVSIACDSQWTEFDKNLKHYNTKLFKIDDRFVFSGTGKQDVEFILMAEFAKNHRPQTNETMGWYRYMKEFDKFVRANTVYKEAITARFCFNWDDKIWDIYNGSAVREVENYIAMGNGSQVAFGALYMDATAEQAVGASCYRNTGTSGAIDKHLIETIKGNER